MGCIPGSRAPPRVITRADCPGDFAIIVSVTTAPCPETAPEPGGRDAVMEGKIAVMGALSLYLDFYNMFLFLLRFMGNRR